MAIMLKEAIDSRRVEEGPRQTQFTRLYHAGCSMMTAYHLRTGLDDDGTVITLPKRGEAYEGNSNWYVQTRRFQPVDLNLTRIEVVYIEVGTPAGDGDLYAPEERVEMSSEEMWVQNAINEIIYVYQGGNWVPAPVTPFRLGADGEGMPIYMPRTVLVLVRYEMSPNWGLIEQFRGTVNGAPWKGKPARTWLFLGAFTSRRMGEPARVEYNFVADREESTRSGGHYFYWSVTNPDSLEVTHYRALRYAESDFNLLGLGT